MIYFQTQMSVVQTIQFKMVSCLKMYKNLVQKYTHTAKHVYPI